MKHIIFSIALVFFFFTVSSCELFNNKRGIPINEDIWVNAYLASWQHDPETGPSTNTKIKTSEINWDAMTHMTYFSLSISEDGTPSQELDSQGNFNSERLNSIVPAAHAHNKTILFSVGGGGNFYGFSGAIKSENQATFMATIHHIIEEYDFDGVNMSMPPFIADPTKNAAESDIDYLNYRANFGSFVRALHQSFQEMETKSEKKPLITLAALKDTDLLPLYAELQEYLDQINILSYDMAQPWRGWQAWHNSALFNEDVVFDDNPSLKFPSIDAKVEEFIASGIARKKIGIAINFYGAVWDGVNLYGKWDGWPTQNMSLYQSLTYAELYNNFELSDFQWDKNARVPYLNLTNATRFVSFENSESIKEKIDYAKEKRLGGIMIWELGGAYFPNRNGLRKEPLLQAVQEHAFTNTNNE